MRWILKLQDCERMGRVTAIYKVMNTWVREAKVSDWFDFSRTWRWVVRQGSHSDRQEGGQGRREDSSC